MLRKAAYKTACSLLALFMVVSACGDYTSRWPKEPFDRKEWIASPQTRFRYVRDLLEAKRLQQLSKAEVLELLGPPAFAPASGNFVEYVVAIKESQPFSLGTVVVLTIEFDANGVVSNQHLRAE